MNANSRRAMWALNRARMALQIARTELGLSPDTEQDATVAAVLGSQVGDLIDKLIKREKCKTN